MRAAPKGAALGLLIPLACHYKQKPCRFPGRAVLVGKFS